MTKLSSEQVRKLRQRLGLTQAEMDKRLGVGRDAVRGWEAGKRPVPGPASLALRLIGALRDAKNAAADAILEALWR